MQQKQDKTEDTLESLNIFLDTSFSASGLCRCIHCNIKTVDTKDVRSTMVSQDVQMSICNKHRIFSELALCVTGDMEKIRQLETIIRDWTDKNSSHSPEVKTYEKGGQA